MADAVDCAGVLAGPVLARAADAPMMVAVPAATAVVAATVARECFRRNRAVAVQQEDMDRDDVLRGNNR
jgi:hypothetical protein